jgi:hypothetical protein
MQTNWEKQKKSENRHQNKNDKKKHCDDEVEYYLGQKEKQAKEGKIQFYNFKYVIVMGTFHDRPNR